MKLSNNCFLKDSKWFSDINYNNYYELQENTAYIRVVVSDVNKQKVDYSFLADKFVSLSVHEKGIKEDLVGFIKLEDLNLLKQMEIHFE